MKMVGPPFLFHLAAVWKRNRKGGGAAYRGRENRPH